MNAAPEYRYTLDEAYLRDASARWASSLPSWKRHLRRLIPPGLIVVLGVWLGWRAWGDPVMFSGVILGLGIGTWFAFRQQRKSRVEAYRATVLENALVRVVVDPEGFEVFTASTHTRSRWSVITKARVFPDGLLLFEGPRSYRWFPDSSLTGAGRDAVESLIKPRVADYSEVV